MIIIKRAFTYAGLGNSIPHPPKEANKEGPSTGGHDTNVQS